MVITILNGCKNSSLGCLESNILNNNKKLIFIQIRIEWAMLSMDCAIYNDKAVSAKFSPPALEA